MPTFSRGTRAALPLTSMVPLLISVALLAPLTDIRAGHQW
jgi:hypothetical protein